MSNLNKWIPQHLALFWVVIVPLAYLLLWALVGGFTSSMSGWRILARRYRLAGPFAGTKWNWQSAAMRYWTRYSNVLVIGAGPEGLYLGTTFLMRAFHPALLVPWSEITVHKRSPAFGGLVTLTLGRESQIPLRLRDDVARRVRSAAGAAYPAEVAG